MRRIVAMVVIPPLLFLIGVKSLSAQELHGQAAIPTPTPQREEIHYILPYPGMLPDNPLYPIKIVRDRLLLFFTRDPLRRIALEIHLSDKYLVMGKSLGDRQMYDFAISTFFKGEMYLSSAVKSYEKLKQNNNAPPGLIENLETATKKHEQVLEDFMFSITNQTKKDSLEGILNSTRETKEKIISLKE
ncbi:hypothetical protein HYW55_06200 [Candidatus Gottesmanbacteria bacterium]|nr:hypothetical protein [Candidatus Gottesmanbacteria bacterium]